MRKKTGKLLLIIFTVNVWAFGFAQGELEIIGEAEHNYGEVREAFRLKSEFILKNKGNNPLYLLRADASKEIKIHASKKKLDPGDTALLQAFYYPVKKGKFKHHISLITSASSHPAQFFIKGEILNVKSDDKNACYSFRQPRTRIKNEYLTSNNLEPVTTKILPEQKDHEITIVKKDKEKLEIPPEVPRNEFDPRDFKENNLIFLIDVSGSMIDSNKLQWLKLSVNNLIKNVRDIEKISIVTYRDTVRCLAENKNNADTAELYQLIRELKAKGITRGNKAIHFALDLAIRNYLPNGNNQIILATDGKFPFTEKDYEIWKLKTSDKKIVLSVLAFGNDKKAIVNLKEISKKGKGNFIQIETLDLAKSAIFEEVKQRSKR